MLAKVKYVTCFAENRICSAALAAVICLALLAPPALWAQTVVSGNITTDTVWAAEQGPYLVTSPVTIQGTDGSDGVTTLTIEPGVRVFFNRYAQLQVGSYSGDPGALKAEGTAQAPIVFTSAQSSPAPGDWYGLRFYNTADDAKCVLSNCRIDYGGCSQGAIYIYQASPTLDSVTIANSKSYGIYIQNGSPSLSGCSFSASGNYDLYFTGTCNSSISNCSFSGGIYYSSGQGSLSFSANKLAWDNDRPVRLAADMIGAFASGTTITNLDDQSHLEVAGGTIVHDATWTDAIAYKVCGSITIQGTDGPDGVTTLTIEPGVRVLFNRYAQLQVGSYSGDPGALKAEGTAQAPIVFTSAQSSPAPGDWYGLRFYNTADDAKCVLSNCRIDYGGYSQGAVYLNNASPKLFNTTMRFSKNYGLYAYGTGCNQTRIECCTFRDNSHGVYLTAGAVPQTLFNNNFVANSQYGLYYSGSSILMAENNWWGGPAGPNQQADAIFGAVDFDPWSATENDCNPDNENRPPFNPDDPSPADGTVRVSAESAIELSWSCDDPDQDTLAYDLYWGVSVNNLQLVAHDLSTPSFVRSDLAPATVYYWKVVAKDGSGYNTAGPVWKFATQGDPPDLTVAQVSTIPAGGMRPGNLIKIQCIVKNQGPGPAVDSFATELRIDGNLAQTITENPIIASGAAHTVTFDWRYPGYDPVISVVCDSHDNVEETEEGNNYYQASFSTIADITPPQITGQFPADGAFLSQVQQINVALQDSQSAVDDNAVKSYFRLYDSAQQRLRGPVSEADDVFTFTPNNLPLADGQYRVSFRAIDTFGNWRNYDFVFTIDSQPPPKPVVTGGIVASGTIAPRPAANTANNATILLEGTCEPGSFVWADGKCQGQFDSGNWSFRWLLSPGNNSIELYCRDKAGNQSPSEWVDIYFRGTGGALYKYDGAGRLRQVRNSP